MEDEPEWMRKNKEEKFEKELAHWLLLASAVIMALLVAVVSGGMPNAAKHPIEQGE